MAENLRKINVPNGFKPFLIHGHNKTVLEHKVFEYGSQSGPDGSRTHVRKQIPFPSTIIVRFEASPPIKDAYVFYRPVSSDTPGARRNWIRRFSHSRSQILKV